MRLRFTILLLFGFSTSILAQPPKVAIMDFDNASGRAEYDVLGKALASMLITDLTNNIHPKKIQFYERIQLNKILAEQKLQKSTQFDPSTAVDFGKMSGVNFVIIGSIYVIDSICNFSAKMVDVQSTKILIAKDVSGKVETWLQLKSQLAEAIAMQFSNPIFLNSAYKDKPVSLSTINQYGKIIVSMDMGEPEKAEQMRQLFEETTPDFKYFSDIKDEIAKIKQRISELENVTEVLTDYFELGDKASKKSDYTSAVKYFQKFIANGDKSGNMENKMLYAYSKLALSLYKISDFSGALKNAQTAQNIYRYYPEANEIELMSMIKLNYINEAKVKFNFIIDSLISVKEIIFIRDKINELLIWEPFYGSYALFTSENSAIGNEFYKGFVNAGYGDINTNRITLVNKLKSNNLDINELFGVKNTDDVFKEIVVSYFKKTYADGVIAPQNIDIYGIEKHLLSYNQDFEKSGISIKGYQNSRLVFSRFIFELLFKLIGDGMIKDATILYRTLLGQYCADQNSIFYHHHWDEILGFRIVKEEDFFLAMKLSEKDFEDRLNKKIRGELTTRNISLKKFDDALAAVRISEPINTKIEIDSSISSKTQIWSKNLAINLDGKGRQIQKAENSQMLFQFFKDSIAAYCYYDFDEKNGSTNGKLYNYWAMKLIQSNLIEGWRIARQSDYYQLLNLGLDFNADLEKISEILTYRKFPFLNLQTSGYYGSNNFYAMGHVGSFWIQESLLHDRHLKIVESSKDKSIRFSELNGTIDYCRSIRLVKDK